MTTSQLETTDREKGGVSNPTERNTSPATGTAYGSRFWRAKRSIDTSTMRVRRKAANTVSEKVRRPLSVARTLRHSSPLARPMSMATMVSDSVLATSSSGVVIERDTREPAIAPTDPAARPASTGLRALGSYRYSLLIGPRFGFY